MRLLILLLCTPFAACVGPRAAEPVATTTFGEPEAVRLLLEARSAIEAGATAQDADALLAARDACVALTGEDAVSLWAFYFAGYADSVLGSITADEEDAVAYIDHGIAHLRAVLERDEDHGEALALLATMYGQKAQHRSLEALGLAATARRRMERALEVAPENPRVVMLHGVRLLNYPGWLGGDAERGLDRLREAELLYRTWTPPDELAPRWGHADCWTWLGVAHTRRDEPDEARAAFEQALALRPGYAWVEETLLPELETARR